jgi:hypothetical protein
MKRRWLIFIVFLAIVGITGYWRRPPSTASQVTWKATMVLERNTRLSRFHLKRPDLATPVSAWNLSELSSLEGKYVIEKDASVSARQLSEVPQIRKIEKTTLLFFSTQNLHLGGAQLNTGAKLYVCDFEKPCESNSYTVEAIVGEKEPYTVALRIPNDKVDYLQKLAKVQLRLASLP